LLMKEIDIMLTSDYMLKSKANWKWNEPRDTTSIIDQLLYDRGLETTEEIEQFIHPKLEYIQSPEVLHQIEKAKQRMMTAMECAEKVMVYGDYDADGVTATALLMTTV